MKIKNVEVEWLGHAGFLLTYNKKYIYIDPYKIARSLPDADYVLITHSHYDHLSVEDLDRIVKDDTVFIAPEDCQKALHDLHGTLRIIAPGKEISFDDFAVTAVPAYNKDKKFHPHASNWVGFVLDFNDVIIYHAGDTDVIDEMKNISADVALLPVSGTYVMTAKEAAKAAKIVGAKQAIPMHYGEIVGDVSDAEEFKKLASCKVVILERKV